MKSRVHEVILFSHHRPGLLDFTGRRKHGAWEKQKGLDKTAAMEAYITEVERQISTYGTKA